MSSGRLVVLDRAGRAGKAYRLRAGEARLGSDAACDIRVMLPAVSPHHATVVVNTMQTVVHSVSERETLVNGSRVTLAALRHGDVISLGGRALRWEYDDPDAIRPLAPEPALQRRVQRKRAVRRGSEPSRRDVFVDAHRASMPAAVSGRQVAIVQPQRRDTSDLSDGAPSLPPNIRPSTSKHSHGDVPESPEPPEPPERSRRKVSSPRTLALANPTKASLWIESRKCSPRRPADTPPPTNLNTPSAVKTPPAVRTRGRTPGSAPASTKSPEKGGRTPRVAVSRTPAGGAPLRLLVLRKAQDNVTKIQAPLKMDSTKQAAIMLMTRHTPKQQSSKRPSYVVKKPSPVRKTPRQPQRSSARHTHKASLKASPKASPKATPTRSSSQNRSAVSQTPDSRYVTDSLIEITDSESPSVSRGSVGKGASPRKSALRDPRQPAAKKNESIKFDLSNLNAPDRSAEELTLRYSDTSETENRTPSPRASLASRRDRILETTLGTSVEYSKTERRSTRTGSPRSVQSLRGISMIRRALENSEAPDVSSYSRRATRSLNPPRSSVASARSTRSLSPRVRNDLESYSIIDLVSTMESDASSDGRAGSVYDSAASIGSTATYDTPVLGSSTPYHAKGDVPAVIRVRGSSGRVGRTRSGRSDGASDAMTTPENSEDATKTITFNSTRISRASKSRSRINDSDVMIAEEEDESSPKSSKRPTKAGSSPLVRKNITLNISAARADSPSNAEGMHTPENRRSPEEATTPMLSIQSLLDASQNSSDSPNSIRRVSKRKSLHPENSRRMGSKSLSMVSERSLRGRDILAGSGDTSQNDEEVVTPKSAVKLVPEGVKNKHSTAKKPQSKRSLIDNLDGSDIVKQLFNSPVKRKLSQSMTEFSRKQLFEDEDVEAPARLTRSALAVAGSTPDDSILDNTEAITPEVFVSPLNTPSNSPNMAGIKRLFQKTTPSNDLRNVRGVKGLLRTPRARKSIKNDLTKVSGVKRAFARSPRNRLSDVRVKDLFAASPNNDLRRVSGVKALFQSQKKKDKSPRNELVDVRGVQNLFRETRSSPRNDLSDVRGVKQIFRQDKPRNDLSDMSGVEQLFHETSNFDSTFDQLMGRPPIRATYIKAKSFTVNRVDKKKNKKTGSKSLHDSIGQITTNVQEWLENELRNRIQKDVTEASTSKGRRSTPNKSRNSSKMVLSRELQKLSTNTIAGSSSPVIVNRTRSILKSEQSNLSSQKRSASELYGAHTLPIKKRSLVEASLNSTDKFMKSNKLPIKKRAVVHSTPVKGRVNITMNVSEIGRMSPISSADKPSEVESSLRALPSQAIPPKLSTSKTKQSKEKTDKEKQEKSVEEVQSPKRTRRSKAALNTTTVRALRGRKSVKENQETNIKKRRSSIVIVKKAPVLSPKPASPKAPRRGRANTEPEKHEAAKTSPKRTRLTRGQKSQNADVKPGTPKRNTRARVRRSSIVVVKPSPKLKPRATRRTKEQPESSEVEAKSTRGKRKTVISESKSAAKKTESSKESQALEPARKTRKTNVADSKAKGKNVDIDIEILVVQMPRTRRAGNESAQSTDNAQTKRTRKASENKPVDEPKATRSRQNIEPQLSVESAPSTRRNTKANSQVSIKSKTVIEDSASKPTNRRTRAAVETRENIKNTKEQPASGMTRGRKRKNTDRDDTVPTETTKQTRSTKSAANEKQVAKSGKGAKNVQSAEVSKPDKEVTSRASRRGVKEVSKSETEVARTSRRGARGKTTSQEIAPKELETGKRTRAAQKQVDAKPVRGKKAPAALQEAPEGGRKKRTNVDISDAKESKKQPAKKARTAAAPASSAASASSTSRAAPASSASPASPAGKLTRTRAGKLTGITRAKSARAGGDARTRGR